jgi:hypothetical protein
LRVVSAAANQAHHYKGVLRSAISLSEGWNTPRRRCGGTIDSTASSFSAATRVDFSGRQSGVPQPQRRRSVPNPLQTRRKKFGARIPREVAKWAKVIHDAKIPKIE